MIKFFKIYLALILLFYCNAKITDYDCISFSGGGARSMYLTTSFLVSNADRMTSLKEVAAISGGTWGVSLYYCNKRQLKPSGFGLKVSHITNFADSKKFAKNYIQEFKSQIPCTLKELGEFPEKKLLVLSTQYIKPNHNYMDFCYFSSKTLKLECPETINTFDPGKMCFMYDGIDDCLSLPGILYRAGSALETKTATSPWYSPLTPTFLNMSPLLNKNICNKRGKMGLSTLVDAGDMYNIPITTTSKCNRVLALDFGENNDCGISEFDNLKSYIKERSLCYGFDKLPKSWKDFKVINKQGTMSGAGFSCLHNQINYRIFGKSVKFDYFYTFNCEGRFKDWTTSELFVNNVAKTKQMDKYINVLTKCIDLI